MKIKDFLRYTTLALGYTFLYLPILILVIYSFNASKLVTVWGGFSGKWYVELLDDKQILGALANSLKIGLANGLISLVLGLLASIVIVRLSKFKGFDMFYGMVNAPLVMPDVIIGISLLLFFVNLESWFGFPDGRGLGTILIAHITFSTAYVTVVISARLREMDRSIEEAAMDLGCTPVKTFILITIPNIMPSLITGFLIALTLSFDDLVISSFVSGPASTTLPMQVFSSVKLGVSPKINAVATLMITFVASLALVISLITLKGHKNKKVE